MWRRLFVIDATVMAKAVIDSSSAESRCGVARVSVIRVYGERLGKDPRTLLAASACGPRRHPMEKHTVFVHGPRATDSKQGSTSAHILISSSTMMASLRVIWPVVASQLVLRAQGFDVAMMVAPIRVSRWVVCACLPGAAPD